MIWKYLQLHGTNLRPTLRRCGRRMRHIQRLVDFGVNSPEAFGCGTMSRVSSDVARSERKEKFRMAEESRINGFAWFLAGLGVGALAGILYAPKSGRETREELANSAREGTEYLRNRSKQVAEQVGGIVDRSREQVSEYVDRGREAVDRGRAQWEEFVERGKSLVGEQGTRVAAAVDAGRQAYRSTTSPSASGIVGGSAGSTFGPSGNPSTSAPEV